MTPQPGFAGLFYLCTGVVVATCLGRLDTVVKYHDSNMFHVRVWFGFVRSALLLAVGTCSTRVLSFEAMPGLCCFLRVTPQPGKRHIGHAHLQVRIMCPIDYDQSTATLLFLETVVAIPQCSVGST